MAFFDSVRRVYCACFTRFHLLHRRGCRAAAGACVRVRRASALPLAPRLRAAARSLSASVFTQTRPAVSSIGFSASSFRATAATGARQLEQPARQLRTLTGATVSTGSNAFTGSDSTGADTSATTGAGDAIDETGSDAGVAATGAFPPVQRPELPALREPRAGAGSAAFGRIGATDFRPVLPLPSASVRTGFRSAVNRLFEDVDAGALGNRCAGFLGSVNFLRGMRHDKTFDFGASALQRGASSTGATARHEPFPATPSR